MKKIVIALVILVAVGFLGCYAWINLGLSKAITEKTLNVSLDEIVNNEHFKDINFHKSYEGGPLFNKYTEYTGTNKSSDIKFIITVDNSRKKVKNIRMFGELPDSNNQKKFGQRLTSLQLSLGLYSTFLSSIVDKNITKEENLNILNVINPVDNNNRLKSLDSYTNNGITYSMGLINSYAVLIEPEQ